MAVAQQSSQYATPQAQTGRDSFNLIKLTWKHHLPDLREGISLATWNVFSLCHSLVLVIRLRSPKNSDAFRLTLLEFSRQRQTGLHIYIKYRGSGRRFPSQSHQIHPQGHLPLQLFIINKSNHSPVIKQRRPFSAGRNIL